MGGSAGGGSTRGTVCVVGSFMMDLVAHAPRRPRTGETLVGSDFSTHLGGKGFNQAVAARRAGAATSLIGRLGKDEFASSFRQLLAVEGIESSGVTTDEVEGTGVGLPVVEPDGQNSIIIVPRSNLGVTPADVEAAAELIEAADVLLLQLELPVDSAVAAARIARAARTTVVVNPAPVVPGVAGLRTLVDVVVPNEVEVRALAGTSADADVVEAARLVQESWRTEVVVTLGGDGVFLVTGTDGDVDVRTLAPCAVEAVDTVGAGDVFCGYLGAALARGASLEAAAERANAAAALAVTRRGAAESAPVAGEVDHFEADHAPRWRTQPVPDPLTRM